MVGALFTAAVSFVCSIFYGFNDPSTISPELVTPLLRKIIFGKLPKPNEGKFSPAVIKDTEF